MKVSPTTVYLIRNVWSEANYKVGVTGNVSRRIAEIEEQYGVEAQLIDSCWFPTRNDAEKAELTWHRRYAENRTDDHGGREWFSLGKTQITEFCDWAELSLTGDALKKWLYREGASWKDLKEYVDKVLRSIPKQHYPPSIDVWTAQTSTNCLMLS